MNRKILLVCATGVAALAIGLAATFSLRAQEKADASKVTPEAAQTAESTPDRTAVYYNNEPYTLDQMVPYIGLSVNNLMSELKIDTMDWSSTYAGTSVSDYVKQDALEILRLYVAITDKADKLGITLTDAELKDVDSWHDDAVKKLGSEEAYEQYLKDNLMSEATYQHIYSVNLLYNHLFDYYYGADGIAKPTQEETDAWGEENELYHINHIYLPTTDDAGNSLGAAQREEQYSLAKQLLGRAAAGEDFDALAAKYSSDGGLKDEYFYLDDADETFSEYLQNLKIGDVSEIIESDYGFHIIKREHLDVQYVLENYPQIVSDDFNDLLSLWTKDVSVVTTALYDGFDVSGLYSKE